LLSEWGFSNGLITVIAIPVTQRTKREIATQGIRGKARVTAGGEFSHVHAVPGSVEFQTRQASLPFEAPPERLLDADQPHHNTALVETLISITALNPGLFAASGWAGTPPER
jgi:hypothetical protein